MAKSKNETKEAAEWGQAIEAGTGIKLSNEMFKLKWNKECV
jgi:hypothetical protein